MPILFSLQHGRLIALGFMLSLLAGSCEAQDQAKPEINLWPMGLPQGAVQLDAKRIEKLKKDEAVHPRGHLLYVDRPTLTVYTAPKEKANGCAVVVCPGGGYNVLAWRHEGLELAEWFNSIGVTAFVLKYRVPRRIPDKIHWEPMQDVQRAIRVVRHRADEYSIDPNRIGVLGFSAGGHLTLMSALQSETECYEPKDEADQASAAPNFVCPIYAAYMGPKYNDRSTTELSELMEVTPKAPPMFMAVTLDDAMRGAQAAALLVELKKNKVPGELHVYVNGGHGYGIRPTDKRCTQWHLQLAGWLKTMGFLKPTDSATNQR